jgi:hypothetical protein
MSDSPISIFTPGSIVDCRRLEYAFAETGKDRVTRRGAAHADHRACRCARPEWIKPRVALLRSPAFRIFNVET